MLDKYVLKEGKRLRYGYTTGSCAAAASKASTIMALTGDIVTNIMIDTPKGWQLHLDTENCIVSKNLASCSVRKDGGDDPDNTHGVLVTATVEIRQEPEILIRGGKGVGVVTKPGLPVSPGNPAINPVPQMMILKEVGQVLPKDKGAIVTISVEDGEEIAKKTFNPKLGIVGGISILGTTGIVEPMSEEAFKESLAMELAMLASEGIEEVVLVPGNQGRDIALEYYDIDKNKLIKTSNFVGYMLEKCVDVGVKRVLLIGHMGKLVKLAGGIFHTHSKVADGRLEILASNLALLGASQKIIQDVFECTTTDAALEVIKKRGIEKVFGILCNKAEQRCQDHVYGKLEVGIIMFSSTKEIVGIGANAKGLLEVFQNE